MLDSKNVRPVIVDFQGKLAAIMYEHERIRKNVQILIKGFKLLKVPILVTEQYPEKLGPTADDIACLLEDESLFPKFTFSIYQDDSIKKSIITEARKQIIIVGIETHICIYQSCLDLLADGYDVYLVVDAVSSRTRENKEIAISRLQKEGVKIVSTEMVLFELMKTCKCDVFRDISKLIK